jgi:hypothetical protein
LASSLNVQYCTSAGLAKYILKYITKSEPKDLYHVRKQNPLKEHLLSRRLGSIEIIILLLNFPIFHMTTASIFLVTAMPDKRSAQIKPIWMLTNDDGDDAKEEPFFKDTIEHYLARPHTIEFENLTYFS